MSCYEESLRLNEEQYRARYEQAFRSWIRHNRRVLDEYDISDWTLLFQETLQGHPVLPPEIQLDLDTDGAFAIGSSEWGSSRAVCTSDLPRFWQPVRLRVASKQPTVLTIQQDSELQESYACFFERQRDFMAILVLA